MDPKEGAIQAEQTETPDVDVMKQFIQEGVTPEDPKGTPKEGTPSGLEPSPEADPQAVNFDRSKVDQLSPEARTLFDDAYKSMQADYTRKTQSLSADKKAAAEDAVTKAMDNLTPNQIGQLAQDPRFQNALSVYLNSVGAMPKGQAATPEAETDEYGDKPAAPAVNPAQEARMIKTEKAVYDVRKQLEHERLGKQYGKFYNRDAAEGIFKNVANGQRLFTMEDAYWIASRDENMRRAYELGKQGRSMDITEKSQATTHPTTSQSAPVGEPLKQNSGESRIDFFRRLAQSASQRSGGKPAGTATGMKTVPRIAGPGSPV